MKRLQDATERRERAASRLARGLAAAGIWLVLASAASPVFAHDNLGGDEFSMAYTIFIVGVVLVAGASLAVLWAARTGQFKDVERAKYDMLKNADDLDDLPVYPDPRPVRLEGGRHASK
jgi:cbb3-type cytochrome oxidase maturation protein